MAANPTTRLIVRLGVAVAAIYLLLVLVLLWRHANVQTMRQERLSRRNVGAMTQTPVDDRSVARWRTTRDSVAPPPQFVFAAGTGRCGTGSLAALFRGQGNGTHVTHEGGRILPWLAAPDDRVTFALWLLEDVLRARGTHRDPLQSTYPLSAVGDVSFWNLLYLDPILQLEPSARVVVLRRPRAEVVDSFDAWTRRGGFDHWSSRPGYRQTSAYDPAFPTYETRSKREAIGLYYDEYYTRAETLVAAYPDRVRIYEMRDALTPSNSQREMLTWLGFANPVLMDIHTHKGTSGNSASGGHRRDDGEDRSFWRGDRPLIASGVGVSFLLGLYAWVYHVLPALFPRSFGADRSAWSSSSAPSYSSGDSEIWRRRRLH